MRRQLLNSTSHSKREAPRFDVIDWFGHKLRMGVRREARKAQQRLFDSMAEAHERANEPMTLYLGRGTAIEFQDSGGEWKSLTSV